MGIHTLHYPGKSTPCHISYVLYRRFGCPDKASTFVSRPIRLCCAFRVDVRVFASRKSIKKSRRNEKVEENEVLPLVKTQPDELDALVSNLPTSAMDSEVKGSIPVASRSAVLQACITTSSLIGVLGVAFRQASHIASAEGWPVTDCSTVLPLVGFEIWHVGLITALVILVSSLRYLLLITWPEFAESSEAANRQVLTSLEPFDYVIVAFLPGVTEELLFRGALLPLCGLDFKGVLLVASLFGILHLGSGRKYSFALWATIVGIVYGYGAIMSSSIIVPMASHAVNNLLGGIIWNYTSDSSRE
ncbi:metalloprotease [Lithospermum erythrorhizon]|uniref:Metalloprotease n=1 Tax=Lithospermum erythrorhizon TaxID=34254 RepID=A0AAV3PW69_LITER